MTATGLIRSIKGLFEKTGIVQSKSSNPGLNNTYCFIIYVLITTFNCCMLTNKYPGLGNMTHHRAQLIKVVRGLFNMRTFSQPLSRYKIYDKHL